MKVFCCFVAILKLLLAELIFFTLSDFVILKISYYFVVFRFNFLLDFSYSNVKSC